jgi:hypothetical protein
LTKTMINRAALVCMTLALIAVLTACGIDDFPENAARTWIEGVANRDQAVIAERTCAAHRADVLQAGQNSPIYNALTRPDDGQVAQIDPNRIYFTLVERFKSQAGVETATVHVTGDIGMARSAQNQRQKVDENWIMMQEDWKWKWCGTKQLPPQAMLRQFRKLVNS